MSHKKTKQKAYGLGSPAIAVGGGLEWWRGAKWSIIKRGGGTRPVKPRVTLSSLEEVSGRSLLGIKGVKDEVAEKVEPGVHLSICDNRCDCQWSRRDRLAIAYFSYYPLGRCEIKFDTLLMSRNLHNTYKAIPFTSAMMICASHDPICSNSDMIPSNCDMFTTIAMWICFSRFLLCQSRRSVMEMDG